MENEKKPLRLVAWLLLVTSQIRMKVNLWKKIKAIFSAF